MSDITVVALITAIPPTLASVAVLVTAIKTKKDLHELHLAVNSRLTQLLDQTAKASKAEGVVEGTKSSQETK